MKNIYIPINFRLILLFVFFFCFISYAQLRIGFGASIGGGTIKGESPSIGAFTTSIFIEEGVGLLALNDRTFSDTDVWGYGVVLSISAGWDLRGFNLSGFKLGAGVEFGITFNSTLARYSSLYLYLNYML